MYSQSNEEEIIVYHFKNYVGKFMDIGAFHPFVFSNTRRLYELDWCGVFVEPSPICFSRFKDEYTFDERVSLVNAAITPNGEPIVFYESNGDALSTTDINHKTKWERAGVPFNEVSVNSISIEDLMNEHKDIDFLNLDVEGKNIELFNAIPDWVFQRLKMICVEHESKESLIKDKLFNFGFVPLTRNSENIILAKT